MSERKTTRSQCVAEDIAALLRARNPLIWVVTREEARVERYLGEAAAAAAYVPRTWDVAQGVVELLSAKQLDMGSPDPEETMKTIDARSKARTDRGAWIMRDLPVWLSGQIGAAPLRRLRNLGSLQEQCVRVRKHERIGNRASICQSSEENLYKRAASSTLEVARMTTAQGPREAIICGVSAFVHASVHGRTVLVATPYGTNPPGVPKRLRERPGALLGVKNLPSRRCLYSEVIVFILDVTSHEYPVADSFHRNRNLA
jgi:hypothetical protein